MHTSNDILQTISFIDATNLNDQATEQDILQLCQIVAQAPSHVASICVYPQWITTVKKYFAEQNIPVATVINFPKPHLSETKLSKPITQAIAAGADEIDIVFPYKTFDPDNPEPTLAWLQTAKTACGDKVLKVIIESGEAPSLDWVEAATACVINSGAQFVKTSTGKTATGATTDAVKSIAYTLHEAPQPCGLKISGGVRTLEQAQQYQQLVQSILGAGFMSPEWFRIGASSLLTECIDTYKSLI